MKTKAALTIGLLVACRLSFLANNPPEYLQSFDPAKGFKPAQRDLVEIFLQIAGSLEFYGSAEPYLRHMAREHTRIEAKYQARYGRPPKSARPSVLRDADIDLFAGNWKHLSQAIDLASIARAAGANMKLAIKGVDGRGTSLLGTLRDQQTATFKAMGTEEREAANASTLEARLADRLQRASLVSSQPNQGEENMALTAIYDSINQLYTKIDKGLKPADAGRVKDALNAIIAGVGEVAQSELEAGIAEWALDQTEAKKELVAYDAREETRLTEDERKQFAVFLAKDRFTRADFPTLDKFYQTAFDKLSEPGKDEMDHRFWEGMRPKK